MDEPPSFSFLDFLSGNNLPYLFITVVLLLMAGALSVAEAAFFSLKPDEIDALRRGNDKRGNIISDLLSNPRLLLTGLTTWKYAMLISAAVIFTIALRFTGQTKLIAEVIVLTLSFAFFGIILPKIYGSTHSVNKAKLFARLCSKLILISKPIVQPLLKMSYKVERKLEELSEENSVKELTQALELAAADKETTEDEKQILRGIVNFGTLTVKQVMRPSIEINSAEINMNFHDLLIYIKKSGFSRIPAYRDTLNMIEGILYIKDLLPFLDKGKNFDWRKLLRPAYFVPESKKIDLLLKDFQEKRVHMALVINDRGETSGIITLEDIIEEIIGDIHDEFDEAYYKKVDEKTFVVDSKIPVNEFCRIMDVEPEVFASAKSENETLGGVLLELHDDLPRIGDLITLEPFTFIIEAVDHKRIKKIRVHIHEQKEL